MHEGPKCFKPIIYYISVSEIWSKISTWVPFLNCLLSSVGAESKMSGFELAIKDIRCQEYYF